MHGMKQFTVAWPGWVLLRAIIALALLTPLPAHSAVDVQPAAAEQAESPPPPMIEPAGRVEPAAVKPPSAPSEEHKATKKIPKKLLRPLLGCWQLGVQERWTISRLDARGAQVVTKLIRGGKKSPGGVSFPDSARRAAIPSTLMYDAHEDNFGFSAAGGIHATLVVFKRSGPILEASLFSRRSRKVGYKFTGNSATLDRCKAVPHARAPRLGHAVVPPRLK